MKITDLNLLRHQAYIDGCWQDADQGSSYSLKDPANGQEIIKVTAVSATETERAIEAAQNAFLNWKEKTAKERGMLLKRWYALIMENQEDLARILSWEQGKSLTESRGEIAYGASFIEWFAEEAKRIYGDIIPQGQSKHRLFVIKQAIGVVGAITPWNFPNAMITRKVAPALAAGCTIVLKPAGQTPLSALALAELSQRAGIPKGVLNILPSNHSREIGQVLTTHPLVKKFTFTGSTEIGRILLEQCASTVKKVSLELGGNAPFIVFEDADIDAAVEGLMASKYRNSGQTCVCTNRVLVQEPIYEDFCHKLVAQVKKLKVAPATQEDAQQGPLINAEAVDKVKEHIADALDKGAKLLIGGKSHALGGNFFEPTILSEVTTQMKVTHEETFGPLAPIFRFSSEQEAISMANDTEYGLASYVYTQDLSRAWRVSEQLEYGIVGLNEGIISTEVAPFGGVKQSGLGREGSKYGIDDFIEMKYICMKLA